MSAFATDFAADKVAVHVLRHSNGAFHFKGCILERYRYAKIICLRCVNDHADIVPQYYIKWPATSVTGYICPRQYLKGRLLLHFVCSVLFHGCTAITFWCRDSFTSMPCLPKDQLRLVDSKQHMRQASPVSTTHCKFCKPGQTALTTAGLTAIAALQTLPMLYLMVLMESFWELRR